MRYDVVTIVASHRGDSRLRELVSQLPPEFGIPIVCLVEADERLVADLAALTKLTVKWAEPGEKLQPGHVYLSPPGASIVIREERRLSITAFGAESSALNPVDSFLASAAREFGSRALGIILAAFPEDGAEGAHMLRWKGGTMLVLDRATSEYYGLADAVVRAGSYDHILTAGEVANALRATFTGRDLLASAEIQLELGLLLDSALRFSGTNMGSVRLREPAPDRLHIIAYRGLGKDFLDTLSIVSSDESSACGRALRLRRRVVVEDVFVDPAYAPYHNVLRKWGFRAVQSTPIVDGHGAVSGVLCTHYPDPHAISDDESRVLDEIAGKAEKLVSRLF